MHIRKLTAEVSAGCDHKRAGRPKGRPGPVISHRGGRLGNCPVCHRPTYGSLQQKELLVNMQ